MCELYHRWPLVSSHWTLSLVQLTATTSVIVVVIPDECDSLMTAMRMLCEGYQPCRWAMIISQPMNTAMLPQASATAPGNSTSSRQYSRRYFLRAIAASCSRWRRSSSFLTDSSTGSGCPQCGHFSARRDINPLHTQHGTVMSLGFCVPCEKISAIAHRNIEPAPKKRPPPRNRSDDLQQPYSCSSASAASS